MLNEQEFLKLISQAIRKNRISKKISSEKLAELTNMDYSSVNLIENCRQNPRSYTLYKLLMALDIDITTCIDGGVVKDPSVKEKILTKLDILSEKQQTDLLAFLEQFELKAK
ncbi:MAG: helix-turn-helix transcriptional regulator [Alphaproteobacteria bacterium]|nr:helix-turn-helix transcriptional regulator [Alphaproteobacteria bacterium]